MDIDLAQLRALRSAVDGGTFEAAARALHVTPSAISQRIRALEVATGQVLLVRSRPVVVTPPGEAVLLLARQVALLVADTAARLDDGTGDRTDGWPTVPVAVNADSLATWFLPAVAPLAGRLCLDLHRADQEDTAGLLRSGTVMAAVTTAEVPVPGCRATRLGVTRYRPMATPGYVGRWLSGGATSEALAGAPVVVFDRADDLQHRWLRSRGVAGGSSAEHHVPGSADFLTAVRLGFGWGMVPELQLDDADRRGRLVELAPGEGVDVELWWQQWKLRAASLDAVSDAVVASARRALAPSGDTTGESA